MKRFFCRMLFLTFLTMVPSGAFGDSLYPLGMKDARLLPKDTGSLRVGISYAEELHNLFQRQNLNRRIAEIPTLSISLGLGERVEGELDYSFLCLEESGQATKSGSGDLTLSVKVGLLRETREEPAVALSFGVKLPNADENDDLGTDQTDFYFQLLGARTFDRFSSFVNLGLAILGDPRVNNHGQDDLLLYGFGASLLLSEEGPTLLFSVEGQDFGKEVNQRGVFRAGLQGKKKSFDWDIGVGIGYASRSEEWSARAGISFPFTLPSY